MDWFIVYKHFGNLFTISKVLLINVLAYFFSEHFCAYSITFVVCTYATDVTEQFHRIMLPFNFSDLDKLERVWAFVTSWLSVLLQLLQMVLMYGAPYLLSSLVQCPQNLLQKSSFSSILPVLVLLLSLLIIIVWVNSFVTFALDTFGSGTLLLRSG